MGRLLFFLSFFCVVYPVSAKDAPGFELRSHVPSQSFEQRVSGFYGEYGVSLAYPYRLDKDVKFYDKVFGSPSVFPSFYYNIVWRYQVVEAFAGINLGYFGTKGEAINLKTKERFEDGGVEYSLVVLPITAVLGARVLLWKDYISFGVYGGYREAYIENVRKDGEEEDDDDKEPLEIDRGWNKSIVYGTHLMFKLDQLSARSQASVKSMNFSSFYAEIFYERSSSISGRKLWGNRSVRKLFFPLDSFGLSLGVQTN